jgi:hypothetical protein
MRIRRVTMTKADGKMVVALLDANLQGPDRVAELLERAREVMGDEEYGWLMRRALMYGLDLNLPLMALATGDLTRLSDYEVLGAWLWLCDRYEWATTEQRGDARFAEAAKALVAEADKRGLALFAAPVMPLIVPMEKAEWTAAKVNDLPDSAFLYIEAGGEKDADGKTTPRSKRHFPIKDAAGKLDRPHLTNAIARIPQSTAPGLDDDKKKALQEKARGMLAELKKADAPPLAFTGRLCKANAAKQIAHFIVAEPGVKDGENDVWTPEAIEGMAIDYMQKTAGKSFRINHGETPLAAQVVQSWIQDGDGKLGEEMVKAGAWCVGVHFPDSAAWQIISTLGTGISPGGSKLTIGG